MGLECQARQNGKSQGWLLNTVASASLWPSELTTERGVQKSCSLSLRKADYLAQKTEHSVFLCVKWACRTDWQTRCKKYILAITNVATREACSAAPWRVQTGGNQEIKAGLTGR